METIIKTIADAIESGEKQITINGQKFNLPEPQGAGTFTQKRFYAELEAKELIKNNIIIERNS